MIKRLFRKLFRRAVPYKVVKLYKYGKSPSMYWRLDTTGKTLAISLSNTTCCGTEVHFEYDVPLNTWKHKDAVTITRKEFLEVFKQVKDKFNSIDI